MNKLIIAFSLVCVIIVSILFCFRALPTNTPILSRDVIPSQTQTQPTQQSGNVVNGLDNRSGRIFPIPFSYALFAKDIYDLRVTNNYTFPLLVSMNEKGIMVRYTLNPTETFVFHNIDVTTLDKYLVLTNNTMYGVRP